MRQNEYLINNGYFRAEMYAVEMVRVESYLIFAKMTMRDIIKQKKYVERITSEKIFSGNGCFILKGPHLNWLFSLKNCLMFSLSVGQKEVWK